MSKHELFAGRFEAVKLLLLVGSPRVAFPEFTCVARFAEGCREAGTLLFCELRDDRPERVEAVLCCVWRENT
ncbi:hypothetical protein [Lysinibacter cavernae]|uniref:Uncharacterized protein n=1 Tax=Lysinibacter cavernae TaxID=1640652 RepID=A0A7X5R302_9MICO|nr:hypothetical protein [Lysinibacter cavernae]NIH54738.1 hypothetical protein [Lysinibacter cavernae]